MGILENIKTVVTSPSTSTTNTTVSTCKAIVFHYTSLTPSGKIANTSAEFVSIEKEILSFEYSKNMGSPSGQFTLQVTAVQNWKKAVFAGDWILVFLSNEGRDTLRVVGNIDRVSQFTTRNDKGLLETSYIITGRDFGKVFEETNIWFDPTNTTRLLLSTLYLNGSPNELITGLIDVFLGGKIAIDALLTQPQVNQWVIPPVMISCFPNLPNLSISVAPGGIRFYNLLKLDIQSVSGKKAIENFASIQGDLWNVLRQNSNDPINEMFCELDGNTPTFVFRSRPFTSRTFFGMSIAGEVNYFGDLPRVEILGQDIIGSDLGYSDEERKNLFLMVSSLDFLNVEALLSQLGSEWPNINDASIQRHGLRLMYVDTEFALLQGDGMNSRINPRLLQDWNRLLYDWYKDSLFMETGTVELERAYPEIRLGKALVIKDSVINTDKIFYIEGYTDSWSYPGNWKQTVHLTRGKTLKFGLEVLSHELESRETIYTGQNVVTSTDSNIINKVKEMILGST